MKISIGTDHAGFPLKLIILEQLKQWGHDVTDFGTFNETVVDYPDIGLKVAEDVAKGESDRGIVICGNGLGMSYVANKVPGIRAAMVNNTLLAHECRYHGNANILSLGGRPSTGGIEPQLAIEILKIFLTTEFAGGRHQERLDKISEIDDKYRKK